MKKKIGILLRIHAVLEILSALDSYEYYLQIFDSHWYIVKGTLINLLSLIIFICLEFLIANLLIKGASPNIYSSKKTPPAKKTPPSKKTPPAKKAPHLKSNLISETFDPAKDTQMFSGYMMKSFREDLNEFLSSSYHIPRGHFLPSAHHIGLMSTLNLTKASLLKTLPELLEKIPDNNRKLFLEMAWETMIEESMSIELEKFLNENNIKLRQ